MSVSFMAPGPPVEALSCICPACDVLLVSVLTQGHVLMGNDLRIQKLPLWDNTKVLPNTVKTWKLTCVCKCVYLELESKKVHLIRAASLDWKYWTLRHHGRKTIECAIWSVAEFLLRTLIMSKHAQEKLFAPVWVPALLNSVFAVL